jgi:Amt family ammonium transporter
VVTGVIAFAIKKTIGLRVPDAVESAGLDRTLHAETAYDLDDIRS